MPAYLLSNAAEQDLSEIWDYTAKVWDEDQADKYLSQIETCCGQLAGTNKKIRTPFAHLPEVASLRCQHHYVFFLRQTPPLVIAVLHENMDIVSRVRDRLGTG